MRQITSEDVELYIRILAPLLEADEKASSERQSGLYRPSEVPETTSAERLAELELREVGWEISHRFGFDGVQEVCDAVMDRLGTSRLNGAWDGVGDWIA